MNRDQIPAPLRTLDWQPMTEEATFAEGTELLLLAERDGGGSYHVESATIHVCAGEQIAFADNLERDPLPRWGDSVGYLVLQPGKGPAYRAESATHPEEWAIA